MQPLKVTIKLSTPMVEPDSLLHLDGLLGALKVKQVMAELGEGIDPRQHHYDLPLERYTSPSGEWVFKASAFRLAAEAPAQVWMQTGRINLAEVARHRAEGWLAVRSAKPIIAGGPLKTSLYHEGLLWAELTAYCVGDLEGVQALLKGCKQIGGRRGVGFGRVAEITVAPVADSECDWQYRIMPVDSGVSDDRYALAIAGLRAPYWDRTMHATVRIPLAQ